MISSLSAKVYDKLEFRGEGIDFIVGNFATSTLYKVIGKPYPPFYTPWRSDPKFYTKEIKEYERKLKEYAESLGYYKAKIDIKEEGDRLVAGIDLGDPIRVESIRIYPAKELRTLIRFKEGSVFNTANFTQSKKLIERWMVENGHPLYDFNAKAYVDIDRYGVNLDFKADKNGTYYFGETTIEGRGDVDEEIIRDEIVYKEGEKFDIREVEKSYDNIYELGVYDYIVFEPQTKEIKDGKKIPMKLSLVMGETKFLKGSIGYNSDEGARGAISWTDKNFLGNLKVFDIGFKVSETGYEAYNIFYNPRIITPYLGKITFMNEIEYKKYSYDTFDETTILNRVTFGKRLFDIEHYFGLLTEYSKIEAKSGELLDESGNYFINSLFYRFLIDKRDSKIAAKNGYYISLYLERSLKGIGSDLDYFKSILELRYIKSPTNRFTYGCKSRIGRIDADVPLFKRFYTGGSVTNRGYEYRDVGIKDSAGVPLGGVSLADMMIEARYRVWRKLSVVAFYDTSLLSLKPDDFNSKFYDSLGFGMRYETVIGPIRLDFGFPQKESGYRFHISIGEAF
jgi:translocation and assembly module TamA